jgi:hypothetical protein
MDTINIQYFYGLGFALAKVETTAFSNYKLNNEHWASALRPAKDWMNNCSTFELEVLPKTKTAAGVLLKVLDDFSHLLGQDRVPSATEWPLIPNAVTDFYNVFNQEVEDIHCYVVTPVGAYAVSALLKNASSHLSEAAQAVVDSEIRKDFDKAGECLALDLYTACGFHAMRAVEAEARIYHEDVTGIYLTDVPLGTLIYGDLKNHPNSGLRTQHAKEGNSHDDPLGLIISLLSQINAIYRRPIMHPEMSLTPAKAKFVFDTAAIAISAMVENAVARFVEKQKAAKAQTAPPPTP